MRRGRILILLGLILAIGTAAAVFILLQGATGESDVVDVERELVVVASQPIPEDESVEGRLELQEVPVEMIPERALHSLEEAEGMLAAGPIPQRTVIHPDLLLSPADLAREGELSKLIEVGYEAVAFPIDELSSVSYGIQPGDHVDILMSFAFVDLDQETQIIEPLCPPDCPGSGEEEKEPLSTQQRARLVAQLTLQDVEILGVGRWNFGAPVLTEEQQAAGEVPEVEPPKFITVMLTPQDALVLKLAREQGASIDLAIRAQDDHQTFATQQVTLDYIMARFGISLPTKQPYGIDGLFGESSPSEP